MQEKGPSVLARAATASSTTSSSSTDSHLKLPRTPRFAEATAVSSPVDARNPFSDPPSNEKTNSYIAQEQVADMGFGYINDGSRAVEVPATPASPLKSALRAPGTPGRILSPMSATFREEQVLEKQEASTEKEQAKDLRIKTRVRLAKVVLRCTNFSCSLIVLALVGTTFAIFNATKALAPRNNLRPWAKETRIWPQVLVLTVASISLLICLVIFWTWRKGGHKRAEKVAVYYTLFAVGFFIFSTAMWGASAGILQGSKDNSNNKDIWGWSCVNNPRREFFQDDINYDLVCRMQSWALICCIIEVVLETFTIAIYGIVFYRYYTKNRLRKSMAIRDRARSDLYLAQLRSQSAPNTPGFGPKSPMSMVSPTSPPVAYRKDGGDDDDDISLAEEGIASSARVINLSPSTSVTTKPFALQKPPIRIHAASPRVGQGEFASPLSSSSPPAMRSVEPVTERRQDHVAAAPGEQTYDAVPIPDAYRSPLNSPGLPTQQMSMGSLGSQVHAPSGHRREESIGEAVTSDHRIESPPGSPRLR